MRTAIRLQDKMNGPSHGTIKRAIHQESGWRWVKYNKSRYQVFDGRQGLFIRTNCPLGGRA